MKANRADRYLKRLFQERTIKSQFLSKNSCKLKNSRQNLAYIKIIIHCNQITLWECEIDFTFENQLL